MTAALTGMQRWQRDYPNRVAIAQAALLALVAFLLNAGDTPFSDRLARCAFIAALVLLGFDTLLTSTHARGQRSISNPARWTYAGHMMWFFGTYMLLATGNSQEAYGWISAIVGAVLFGSLMAFAPFADGGAHGQPLPPGRYDESRPLSDAPIRYRLYLIWPALSLALVAIALLLPTQSGYSDRYGSFLCVWLPWIFQLYPNSGPVPWLKGMWAIKSLGLICLTLALFLP